MTLRELLRSSFRLVGVLREGQGANGDDIADGLVVLNSMLSSWSVDRLNIYDIRRDVYTLSGGKQTYTIGTGGDFAAARPLRIDRAAVIVPSSGLGVETPIGLLDPAGWADVRIKDLASSQPSVLYADNAYPLCNLNVWPVPTGSLSLVLYTWAALNAGFAVGALDSEVSFPPGYEDAIRYNLAVRLAPEWGRDLRADVAALAISSKMHIESLNAPAPVLRCDPAIVRAGRRGGWFDYRAGGYGR